MELSRHLEQMPVRPVDYGPGADVPCRDVVGRPSVPARDARKPIPCRPVRLGAVPAFGTGLARVRRVDGHQQHPSKRCLVLEEGTLLEEGPAMQTCSLSASGRYPVANTLEILQGNAAAGAFCLLHESLADPMVDVSPETSLSSGNLPELPLRRPGPSSLQVASAVGVGTPDAVDIVARVDLSITVGGEVDDTQVHTEEVVRLDHGALSDLAGNDEQPLAGPGEDEVDLADARLQHLPLSFGI